MKRILLALAMAALATGAAAQGYPSKPIRLIVPFPGGSTPDTVARTLAQRLNDAWGQPVVVENKTGAGGNIGTAEAAKSAPDGYTLVIGINGPVEVNKTLYKTLPYDPDKDLQPISLLAVGAQMLAIHPSVPASNLKEFVDYARKNPGKLSYGSVGAGSGSHLTMELLKSQAKLEMVHVPYRGFPPAVQDLLAGNIHATFAIVPAVLGNVKAGKLKGIAVTSEKRSELAPDVPTIAEQGFPTFDATVWIGLLAPAPLPKDVLARIAAETQKGMADPALRKRLGASGFQIVGGTPEHFASFIRSESKKWGDIVKLTGAKVD